MAPARAADARWNHVNRTPASEPGAQWRSTMRKRQATVAALGHTWRVNVTANTVVVHNGLSVPGAPSGSFEVKGSIVNRPGTDVIRVVATNVRAGATFRGAVSYAG
jgi:hypothetical protein